MSVLDDYMTIFEQSEERSSSPTTDRTSERDVNVPFPVLPGALSSVKAPASRVMATPTAQRSSTLTTPSRYTSTARPLAPMMLLTTGSTARAAKAAGGPLPPPSPAMGASLPPPPDAPTAPMPPPPDAAATPPSIITNANRVLSVGTSAPSACPPCAAGSSRGFWVLLLAAGAAYWMSNIKR